MLTSSLHHRRYASSLSGEPRLTRSGFNVPIAITPTGGVGDQCQKVTCGAETDLLTQCDPALAFPSGSDTVCKSFTLDLSS